MSATILQSPSMFFHRARYFPSSPHSNPSGAVPLNEKELLDIMPSCGGQAGSFGVRIARRRAVDGETSDQRSISNRSWTAPHVGTFSTAGAES